MSPIGIQEQARALLQLNDFFYFLKSFFGRVTSRQKGAFTEESDGETAGVPVFWAATVTNVHVCHVT
jgi:hypothetical protein